MNSVRHSLFAVLILSGALLSGALLQANPFFEQTIRTTAPVVQTGPGFLKEQLAFRERIAAAVRELRERPSIAAFSLLALFSALYGFFHALGPGHRKGVLFTLFISRKSHWYEPLFGGLTAAGVHAASSIVLISLLWIAGRRLRLLAKSENAYSLMETGTFLALALVALCLIVFRVIALLRRSAVHDKLQGNKSFYSIVFLSSLVPCPGASMLLLLAFYSGLFMAGFVGVFAMSAGMAVVTTLSAYLGWAGRKGIFTAIKSHERGMSIASAVVEIISYVIILAFSLFMTAPFLLSVFQNSGT